MGRFKYITLPIFLLLCLLETKGISGSIILVKHFEYPLLWEPQTIAVEFDTSAPKPVWTMNCDGSVDKAVVIDMPENDAVRTNLNLVKMHKNVSFNYDFIYNPDDIRPCKNKETKWGLRVKDPSSDARAEIEFSDCAGNDTTIIIEYFAPTVIIKPKFASFGIVTKGSSVYTDFWLINWSDKKSAEIKRLELKDKDKGFTISDTILPITLKPKDTVLFKVNFTATEEGKFMDSIGFGTNCVYLNVAQVEATVRQSIIKVSDALFEDLPIKKTDTLTVDIKNDGNVDLIITGYNGPTNPAFTTNLPEISSVKTLTLKPNDPPFQFEVSFSPLLEQTYRDSIIFFSGANQTDNVAVLSGNGIQPGMISTSYDWGRKRIGNEYTAGNECIILENTSDEDVIIYGFAKKVDKGGEVFHFDENLLNNVTIQSGKKIFIPVKFKPMNVGNYELVIAYDNSINSQTETRFFGTGVKPEMITEDVTFDISVVEWYQYPIHDTVRFINVDSEFADTIKINDLIIQPVGDEISSDIERYGNLGFKFDKKSLHLPRIILPGEVFEIPMMFVAKQEGNVIASIKTVSDIEPEQTSNINGFGINEGINITADKIHLSTCLGGKDTITYQIENIGSESVDITSLNINQNENHFDFEDQSQKLGFVIESGKTEPVNIIFKPDRVGLSTADFVVYNNTKYNDNLHNDLEGEGIQKKRSIRVDLMQENNRVLIGNMFQTNIILEPGEEIDYLDIKQLYVEIRYNGGIIKTFPEDIRIGDMLEGRFQINNLSIADIPGIIRLTLDTLAGIPGQKLSGDGELLKIIYHAYMPTSKDTSDKSVIDPYISPVSSGCLDFSDTKIVTVQIDPVCMNEIRKIDISTLNYGIGAINPNPVGTEGSEVFYSIGLEGNTHFEILNSQGAKIYSLSYQNQKPGVYTFSIPSESLESGVYWFRMVSGPFSSIKEFIIIK